MADRVEGFPPLPALTEAPDPARELRLQDALADRDGSPVLDEPAPYPLGRAPAYDFATRRFIPGAAGGPLMTRGIATLTTWVDKCLRTRRAENPGVHPDFGCDLLPEDLLGEGEPFDASAISEYLAAVDRALRFHPRITAMTDTLVEHEPDDDFVLLSFRLEIDDPDEDELTFNRLRIGG